LSIRSSQRSARCGLPRVLRASGSAGCRFLTRLASTRSSMCRNPGDSSDISASGTPRQSSTDLNLREPTGNIDARRRNLRFDA